MRFGAAVEGLARRVMLMVALVGAADGQIIAPGGRTLFNRAVMVRTFVRVDRFERAPNGVSTTRLVNLYALVWGAFPNTNLTFVAPLVSMERSGPSGSDRSTSFGDGAVFARYDLLRHNVRGGFTRLSPEVGVKLPSGGAFGSGSTDAIGGLVFSHVRDPHWLVADAQFTYRTANEQGVRRGNLWNYDLAYMHRLLPREELRSPTLYLVLEANGEHQRRASIQGVVAPNSGGDVLFLSPGVELIPNRRIVVEFSLPVPVWRNLNGAAIRPRTRFLVGIRWLVR